MGCDKYVHQTLIPSRFISQQLRTVSLVVQGPGALISVLELIEQPRCTILRMKMLLTNKVCPLRQEFLQFLLNLVGAEPV